MDGKKILDKIMSGTDGDRVAEIKRRFCVRLNDLRQEKNLSQKEVSDKIAIPVSTYANWEQGRREPGIFDIYSILWALDIEATDLFSLDY